MSMDGLMRVDRVLAALVLCLDCEHLTGDSAARKVTQEGRCATCGSNSVINVPRRAAAKDGNAGVK